jgi:hypothetical protein
MRQRWALLARDVPPPAQRGPLLIRLYSTSGSRQIRQKTKNFLKHFGPGASDVTQRLRRSRWKNPGLNDGFPWRFGGRRGSSDA